MTALINEQRKHLEGIDEVIEVAADVFDGLVNMIRFGPPIGPVVAGMVATIGPGIVVTETWRSARRRWVQYRFDRQFQSIADADRADVVAEMEAL